MTSKDFSKMMEVGRKVVAIETITEDKRGDPCPTIPNGTIGEVVRVVEETASLFVNFCGIAGADSVMVPAYKLRPAKAKDFE